MTRTVRFHWKDGKVEEAEGSGEYPSSIADSAFQKLGYTNMRLCALVSWEIIEPGHTQPESECEACKSLDSLIQTGSDIRREQGILDYSHSEHVHGPGNANG